MSEAAETEAAASGRIDLPRGHWVELKDPWEITERERNAIVADNAAKTGGNRASRRQNAGLAGTAPASDDEDPRAEFLAAVDAGHGLVARFISAWGGPLLDGKPITQETLVDLPAPLYVAIDAAVTPALREVFPRAKKEDPTEP